MKPILCNYYLTYRCNARCVFCDIWRLPKTPDAVPEVVLRNLPAIRALGVRFIDFTGGEPLLYKELPALLQAAKHLGLVTSVTTNGLLYPQRAEELAGLVDLLHFSLDADTPQLHDKLRGVPCFHRVMESVDKALAIGEKPDLLYTVTNSNIHAIEGLAAFAQQRQLILIVNPVFSYFNNTMLTEGVVSKVVSFFGAPYVYVNLAFLRLIKTGGNAVSSPRCRAVTSTMVLSPDNHLLLPCFHHPREAVAIDGDIAKVWKSNKVRSAERSQGRYPFCEGCTINCYFDPSFLYQGDGYFWESMISKAKYGYDKYIRLKKSSGKSSTKKQGGTY